MQYCTFSLGYLCSQANIDQHDHEQSWPQGCDRKFRHNFWVYNKSQTRTCKNILIMIRVSCVIVRNIWEIITNSLNFVLMHTIDCKHWDEFPLLKRYQLRRSILSTAERLVLTWLVTYKSPHFWILTFCYFVCFSEVRISRTIFNMAQ